MRGPPDYDSRRGGGGGWGGPRGRMGGPPPGMMEGRGGPYRGPHPPMGGGPGFRGGGGGGGGFPPAMGPPPQEKLLPAITVDREKTCPLLLRVFPKRGGHHRLEEYAKRGSEPEGELQIYTWPDATLRELTELIKDVRRDAASRGARLSFSFVYPDRRGQNVMKEVGVVWAESARRTQDDTKSLHQLAFQTGDFLDVAIL